MNRTIKWHLIVSFISVSFVIISVFSLITVRLMDTHFITYISERQEKHLSNYATSLEKLYNTSGEWPEALNFESIGIDAIQNSIILTVYDNEKNEIWHSSNLAERMSEDRMNKNVSHMESMMGGMNQTNMTTTVSLFNGTKKIGFVDFTYMGPVGYSEHDTLFITDMKNSLILVSIVGLILSIFMAMIVAHKISSPIINVKNFTKNIARGTYSNSPPKKTTIKELEELFISVSTLSVQLENQQEIRNQLSSDIAHEIRTPLTTLKGSLEAMIDGIWDPTEERLQVCYDEVNRLTRLIGNIDKINEFESQQTILRTSSFDLYTLAKDIASNFDSLFIKQTIFFSIEGLSLLVIADKDKISQVLTNLLSNAIKFTPAYGQIKLVIEQKNNLAVLTLSDTGEGIAKDELNSIFERFYMSDYSRRKSVDSQGIGLSIVKSIVKAHSGNIVVKSDYGKGSTFTITFPIVH
ncbi:MAG: HAMP domain-containing sensor histidine kinase [Carnobacterium sp.]|uniref:HAMP domain-containing sensor histidine kinase n=1 Tax=Carnobacterium sp. TaxID=48221 RepID=UPI003C77459F